MQVKLETHPFFSSTFKLSPLGPLNVVVTDPRIYNFGLPKMETAGSAGLDLRAFWPAEYGNEMTIEAGQQMMLDSGLKVWIEAEGFVGLLFPRSSSGVKGLVLGNGTGVIDSDYQGPLKLCLWNRGDKDITINLGDRVAQLVIIPAVTGYNINIVNDFESKTERGEGGFGSTGSK